MSYILKPKNELLEHLDLIESKLFPPPLPREVKALLAETKDRDKLHEDCLDAVEGLIVRISRCPTFEAMGELVRKANLSVQACLWERFMFLKQFACQLPDDPQMVPASIGRYLREGLSALWHEHQSSK